MEKTNIGTPLGKLVWDLSLKENGGKPEFNKPMEIETESGTYGILHLEGDDDAIYVWTIESKF